MARFVFKLKAALWQRKNAEQQVQREMAAKVALLAALQEDLRRLQESVGEANQDLVSNRLTGTLDLQYLAAHRRYLNALQRQGVSVVQKIAAQQKLVDEARVRLSEAAKRRKVIETLRDKRLEQWKQEQSAKELRELDEIGMQISYANITKDQM